MDRAKFIADIRFSNIYYRSCSLCVNGIQVSSRCKPGYHYNHNYLYGNSYYQIKRILFNYIFYIKERL